MYRVWRGSLPARGVKHVTQLFLFLEHSNRGIQKSTIIDSVLLFVHYRIVRCTGEGSFKVVRIRM